MEIYFVGGFVVGMITGGFIMHMHSAKVIQALKDIETKAKENIDKVKGKF